MGPASAWVVLVAGGRMTQLPWREQAEAGPVSGSWLRDMSKVLALAL